MSRKSRDTWVRNIDVSDPILHEKGFTLYKVTSKVFPKNSVEAVSHVTVWKRYNDFKRLHKALSTLHQNLYLKDPFPSFAKTRFFGRFDPLVIEERRQSALQLLQFAANCSPLFTSQVFVKFFEDSHVVEEANVNTVCNEDVSCNILQPQKACLTPENAHKNIGCEEKTCSNGDTKTDKGSSLGGIWQHHQGPDTISLGSHCTDEEDDDDRTTFTDDDSTVSRPSLNLSEFDPLLLSVSEEKTNQENLCNSWLLSALQSYSSMDCEKDMENNLEFPAPFGDFDLSDVHVSPLAEHQNGNDCVRDTKENHFTFEVPTPVAEAPVDVLEFDPLRGKSDSVPDEEDYDRFVMTPNAYERDSQKRPSYVVQASNNVSLAQEAEEEGRYQDAFDLYKKTIDILLQGYQKDKCSDLRDLVRKKVLFYLMRAEELYETKLPKSNEKPKMVYPNLTQSPLKVNTNTQESLQDLNKYKVLGVLDKVLLVLDTSTNSTFIIKTLYKSPCPQNYSSHIVPKNLPFVVKLHQIYETSHALFLILEHATGGRLWDYVSSFLQRSPLSPCTDGTAFSLEDSSLGPAPDSSPSNVYSGKKMVDGDEPRPDPDVTPGEATPPSYVALFKRYANDAEREEHVSLAKYHRTRRPRGKRRSGGVAGSSDLQNETGRRISTLHPPKSFPNRLSSSTGSLERTYTQKACNLDALNAMDEAVSQPSVTVHLPESCINMWAAEIVLALESLHNLGIIWADFNPDNILLGAEGHILLTYQGKWSNVDFIASESAKVNLYCAPEVGSIFPVNFECDWWSLGSILFELLMGQSLVSCHPTGISRHTTLNFPKEISSDAKDFVSKLLQFEPSERLGSGIYGMEEIKSHPFFRNLDWKSLPS